VHRRERDVRCRPLKHFDDDTPLLKLFHESPVGIIANNTVKLRLVVSDHAGVIDDHVVYTPISLLAP